MRLWHEELLPYLPQLQFNGQHRECCALRGAGWGKKHATVNYVFKYPRIYLVEYHTRYLHLRSKRDYIYNSTWLDRNYRGTNCPLDTYEVHESLLVSIRKIVYPEHDKEYLDKCILNIITKILNEPYKYSLEDIERFLLFEKVQPYKSLIKM